MSECSTGAASRSRPSPFRERGVRLTDPTSAGQSRGPSTQPGRAARAIDAAQPLLGASATHLQPTRRGRPNRVSVATTALTSTAQRRAHTGDGCRLKKEGCGALAMCLTRGRSRNISRRRAPKSHAERSAPFIYIRPRRGNTSLDPTLPAHPLVPPFFTLTGSVPGVLIYPYLPSSVLRSLRPPQPFRHQR